MSSIRIGQKQIAYKVHRTARLSERRITITPGKVEVLALTSDKDDDIELFLNRKRQWIFKSVREIEDITANRAVVPRFMTGSKIPFRGRMLSLKVERTEAEQIQVSYKKSITIQLPLSVKDKDRDAAIASELKLWLQQCVRRDVLSIVANYIDRFNLKPKSIRTCELKTGWGSCGPNGTISINWNLVFAPRKVLEYVVVHELAHLRYRSHDQVFWSYLAKIYPEYQQPKAWLDKHQGMMDSNFLETIRKN